MLRRFVAWGRGVMQRFWGWVALNLGRRAGVTLLVIAGISVVAVFGVRQLDFATGQDSYLNADSQTAIDNEDYQELFGGQAMLTLFTAEEGKTLVDLFTEDNLEQFAAMEATLRDSGRFNAVVSPLTALQFTQNLVTIDPETGEVTDDPTASAAGQMLLGAREREPDEAAVQVRTEDSLQTLTRLEEIPPDQRDFSNPDWVEFLLVDNRGEIRKSLRPFFPFAPGVEPTLENAEYAQMVVRMGGNLSIEDEGADSDLVLETVGDAEFENFSTLTTGAPVLLEDINDYLQGGMLTLGGIAVVIMAIVLFFVFRVRWRLLSLAVVLVGVLWAFALLGFIGIDLSLVTISGLPILIGMGVDFSIQVHNRVEEEVVLDQEEHFMRTTLKPLAPALLIATFAAALAFLGLQVSRVPMIRDFGILLALGIVVLFVIGIVGPTAALGYREYHYPTTEVSPPSIIERWVVWLGSLPRRAVPVLLVVGVLLIGFGVALEGDFKLQTDPEEWVDQDTQVIQDLQTLRESTGGTSELGVFFENAEQGIFNDETAALMSDFAVGELDANEGELLTASSLATTVTFLLEMPDTTDLPPTGADLEAAYAVAPEDIRKSVVNGESDFAEAGTFANMIFRTGPSSLEQRADLLDQFEDDLAVELEGQDEVRATPSGLAVVGVGLLRNLEANRTALTYVSLALVAVFLFIRYLSFFRMLLTLVPVLIAVGTTSIVVSVSGFELSPLTTVTGPLVIATCTEFTVLIMMRYLEERRRGLGSEESSDRAAARTGRAFVASALTTIGGFGVLAFSALPLLRDFGIIVTLNVAVALLSALIVLPPLLKYADDKGVLRTHRPGQREPSPTEASPTPADPERAATTV